MPPSRAWLAEVRRRHVLPFDAFFDQYQSGLYNYLLLFSAQKERVVAEVEALWIDFINAVVARKVKGEPVAWLFRRAYERVLREFSASLSSGISLGERLRSLSVPVRALVYLHECAGLSWYEIEPVLAMSVAEQKRSFREAIFILAPSANRPVPKKTECQMLDRDLVDFLCAEMNLGARQVHRAHANACGYCHERIAIFREELAEVNDPLLLALPEEIANDLRARVHVVILAQRSRIRMFGIWGGGILMIVTLFGAGQRYRESFVRYFSAVRIEWAVSPEETVSESIIDSASAPEPESIPFESKILMLDQASETVFGLESSLVVGLESWGAEPQAWRVGAPHKPASGSQADNIACEPIEDVLVFDSKEDVLVAGVAEDDVVPHGLDSRLERRSVVSMQEESRAHRTWGGGFSNWLVLDEEAPKAILTKPRFVIGSDQAEMNVSDRDDLDNTNVGGDGSFARETGALLSFDGVGVLGGSVVVRDGEGRWHTFESREDFEVFVALADARGESYEWYRVSEASGGAVPSAINVCE